MICFVTCWSKTSLTWSAWLKFGDCKQKMDYLIVGEPLNVETVIWKRFVLPNKDNYLKQSNARDITGQF